MATTTPRDLVTPLAERPGVRRRHRHHLRRQRRRHLRRHHRRALRVVQRQAARPCGTGRTEHDIDLREQLRLLRQRLRHAAAVRRRPSRRRQPRPAAARHGASPAWPVLHLDVPPGVPKLPILSAGAPTASRSPSPARRPSRSLGGTSTARSTSRPPARPSSWQPSLVLRRRPPWPWPSPAAAARSASWGRRRCSTPRSSVRWPRRMGGIRVERAHRLGRAAAAMPPTRSQAGQMVAIMPQGTIPRGRAFFEPVLKGRWGAARLAAMTGAPVIPGRDVGDREGLAPVRAPTPDLERDRSAGRARPRRP